MITEAHIVVLFLILPAPADILRSVSVPEMWEENYFPNEVSGYSICVKERSGVDWLDSILINA